MVITVFKRVCGDGAGHQLIAAVGKGLGCAGDDCALQVGVALHLHLKTLVASFEAGLLSDAFKIALVITLVEVNAATQGGSNI
jgi:hypothetical protein